MIQEGTVPSSKGGKGGRSKGGKKAVCWNYKMTGKCSYGDQCKFEHEQGESARRVLTESEYEELQRLRAQVSSREPSVAGKSTHTTPADCTPKSEKFGIAMRERNQRDREQASAYSVRRAKNGATVSQISNSVSGKSDLKSGKSGGTIEAARKTKYPSKRQVSRSRTAPGKTKSYVMTEKDKVATLKAKHKISTTLKKGPIIDSAATVPILTVQDSKKCEVITELQTPQKLDTIDGTTTAKRTGSMVLPVVGIQNALILNSAKESVIPTSEICAPGSGLAYYQDEKGAAILDIEQQKIYECPADGKVYREIQILMAISTYLQLQLSMVLKQLEGAKPSQQKS